ncbi:MAG: dihydrodipicolinate synthase family protein, partial [Myxococcota bacterium]
DIDQIAHVIDQCPKDFDVLSGDDSMTLPVMAMGGQGVISTTSNVAPEQMLELVRVFRSGDSVRALSLHQQLMPLFDALFCETNPIPLKAALGIMGLIDPEIRLPLTPITQPNREALQVTLKELGFA